MVCNQIQMTVIIGGMIDLYCGCEAITNVLD